jgi:penicillin-binding protein 1A
MRVPDHNGHGGPNGYRPPVDGLAGLRDWLLERTPAVSRRTSALLLRAVSLVVLTALIALVVSLGLAGAGQQFAKRISAFTNVSVPKIPPGPQTTFIYDRKGNIIGTLHAGVNRIPVPLSAISKSMQQAAIAIEDKNFYRHGGVEVGAILRAAIADFTHHAIEQGGSTITQQYVKNVYLSGERTISRKLREAVLAQKLEHIYTKNQILERYLNAVYFGNGAYGVEAAAQTYWGIHASKLNPLQSATLAGLIQAPASYDPILHRDEAKERRNRVLEDMAQQGYITEAEALKLEARPVKVSRPRPTTDSRFAYFVDFVSKSLQRQFGVDATFSGGLRVQTTLDSAMQLAAERAVASHLGAPGDPAAALVAIDPRNGEIRAMVGGQNFARKKFNLATQAHRQAGSAFKPFTLVTALEQGISLNSIWVGPPHLTINDRQCLGPKGPWDVSNYADEAAGTMNLMDGIAHSVNTIFAQVVVKVGPANVARVARSMGITSPLQSVCSITLGSQAVSPLDMADAYATLASRGIHHAPTPIAAVKDPSGKTVFEGDQPGKRVVPQNVADLATLALEGVIQKGTGVAANIGRPAAGKTGTAESFQDAWFCGYTPQLVTCVWVGYPKGEIPMHYIHGFPDVFGGSIPAEIWHDFMAQALANYSVLGFATPLIPGSATFESDPSLLPPPPSPSPSPSPCKKKKPKPCP